MGVGNHTTKPRSIGNILLAFTIHLPATICRAAVHVLNKAGTLFQWRSNEMETKGFSNSSLSRSTPDRLLGLSNSAHSGDLTDGSSLSGADFNEDDVLWTNDWVDPNHRRNSPSAAANSDHLFRAPESQGILAALPDSGLNEIPPPPLLNRKTSFPSSIRAGPPKPKALHNSRESMRSQSLPIRRFHQSAPINVPTLSKARSGTIAQADDDDDDDEDEMLPPHEIVARGSRRSPRTTSSMLEGVGRTLKGRDQHQVRDAVWRTTGFLK